MKDAFSELWELCAAAFMWLRGYLVLWEPFGIAFAIVAFVISIPPLLLDLEDRDVNRTFQAWQVLGTDTGDSFAKRDALVYLNEKRSGSMCSVLVQGIASWMVGDNDRECVQPAKQRTKLSGIALAGVNLAYADLREARLDSADLFRADLFSADLSGADLSGADLSEAHLAFADLIQASLYDADLSEANAHRANLAGAIFVRANLSGANLAVANLSGANLIRANLIRANLGYADLIGAGLSDADLSGADVSGADLSGADLGFATLGGAWYREGAAPIGIDIAPLKKCPKDTTWPDGC